MAELPSTRAPRDFPMLSAALSRLDAGEGLVDVGDLQRDTGLSREQLWAGLRALNTAEPPYLIFQGGVVLEVSERARRELGTWPAADSLVDALAAAFAQAAEAEKEPERKQRLRAVADGPGGALRDIAVSVISKRLGDLLPTCHRSLGTSSENDQRKWLPLVVHRQTPASNCRASHTVTVLNAAVRRFRS